MATENTVQSLDDGTYYILIHGWTSGYLSLLETYIEDDQNYEVRKIERINEFNTFFTSKLQIILRCFIKNQN